MNRGIVIGVALAAAAGTASGQMMAVDSGGDRIMLIDQEDGSVLDANWLSDASAVGWAFSTPKEAKIIGDEIWVVDQIEDAILRFDMDHQFLGSITEAPGGLALNNMRSLGTDGTTVWVTADSSPVADSVISYDTDGNPLDIFMIAGSSPFDAEPFMGDLLVSDSNGPGVDRFQTDGTFVSNFASGLGFAEQVVVLPDNSVLVANAIDSAGVEGVYHYDSEGFQLAFIDTAAIGGPTVRGANLLDNGDYIIGSSAGLHTARSDGAGGFDFTLITDEPNIQYITRMGDAPPPDCYADCDDTGTLDFFDFLCFQNLFAAGDPEADCDETGTLDFFDFLCFQNAFAAGCP